MTPERPGRALERCRLWGALLAAALLLAAGATAQAEGGNRLATEASPFLRLHAGDPIDWHPYGDEAFATARRLGRPLFLSIGYATCSGCLRMAEESFDDPVVGAALNADFVAVLVDRDGQPDLADAYARSALAMGERVGFPLHVFLLPDGSPFHASTFLPRHDEPARPGILTVLSSVKRALASGATPLARRGEALRAELNRQLQTAGAHDGGGPTPLQFEALVAAQRAAGDPEWGGRLLLPKRVTEPSVALLLRHHRRSGDARSLAAALRTLDGMARGPVRDAENGGFYEGATQRDWSEPRPEQRLADNALLALAYLEGWQASGRADMRQVAYDTLDFLLAQLGAADGAFYAMRSGGRRDPQLLTGANGLAISALARGGFALSEPRFVEAARAAASFLLEQRRGAEGLRALVAEGRLGPPAALADHALVIAGLLDLLEVDAEIGWLDAALALDVEQQALFSHPEGGYYCTRSAPGPGLPRPRHARDGALPSGQAVATLNALRLHALSGEARYRERADDILRVFRDSFAREPLAHATLGLALDARLDGLHEIVVASAGDADASALLEPLRRSFVPNRVILIVNERTAPPLTPRARLLEGKRALTGSSTAFVCRDHVCTHPARDASSFTRQLASFTPHTAGP